MSRRRLLILSLLLLTTGAGLFYHFGRSCWHPYWAKLRGRKTVAEIVDTVGPQVTPRLQALCSSQGLPYPPGRLALLADKRARRLQVWASADPQSPFRRVADYPILGSSGRLGPKLREGDGQVPEGVYRISGLNPNSAFHLSMKIDYPNAFDLEQAEREGRNEPGSDIFIHGNDCSIGCLAMGDPVIEELFLLVEAVGLDRVQVIIAPYAPGAEPLVPPADTPPWTPQLYAAISSAWLQVADPGG